MSFGISVTGDLFYCIDFPKHTNQTYCPVHFIVCKIHTEVLLLLLLLLRMITFVSMELIYTAVARLSLFEILLFVDYTLTGTYETTYESPTLTRGKESITISYNGIEVWRISVLATLFRFEMSLKMLSF